MANEVLPKLDPKLKGEDVSSGYKVMANKLSRYTRKGPYIVRGVIGSPKFDKKVLDTIRNEGIISEVVSSSKGRFFATIRGVGEDE